MTSQPPFLALGLGKSELVLLVNRAQISLLSIITLYYLFVANSLPTLMN